LSNFLHLSLVHHLDSFYFSFSLSLPLYLSISLSLSTPLSKYLPLTLPLSLSYSLSPKYLALSVFGYLVGRPPLKISSVPFPLSIFPLRNNRKRFQKHLFAFFGATSKPIFYTLKKWTEFLRKRLSACRINS